MSLIETDGINTWETENSNSYVLVPIQLRGKSKPIIEELLKQRNSLERQLEYAKEMLRYYIPTSDELRQILIAIDEKK